jgi:hypothetical protein
MSVVLPVRQDERRIEIAFDALKVVLNVGALGGKVAIAESKHFDLFLWNMLENRGCANPRLIPTRLVPAKNDPSHVEARYLGSNAQNCSAAADLDVVGVGTQTKQSK